jgi:anaerobic magnesium-protoporphyrin IX monomethyl ester cyclase
MNNLIEINKLNFGRKVLFIYPPSGLFRRDERCQSAVEDQTVKVLFPPMDHAYGAAILEKANVECRILDMPSERLDNNYLSSYLINFIPDWLFVKVTTSTLKGDLESCLIAKKTIPDSLIFIHGGSKLIDEIKNHEDFDNIDFIITSDFEDVLMDITSGVDIENIQGVTSKENIKGSPFKSTFRNKRELDDYPFPARHLLKNELYVNPENGKKIALIRTCKGCSFKCIFCPAYEISKGTIKRRSPENIIAEIEECVKKFEIDDFQFDADTFTLNKNWTEKLCQELISKNLKISWYCNSRVDTVDESLLELMKKAGCRVIGYGIESGSQETLDRIKKNITLDQARRTIEKTKNAGIYSHTFFVIGFPWETREMVEETINFIRELNPDFFDINIAFPLPGTELYRICIEENLFEYDGKEPLSYSNSPIRTIYLSRNELIELRKRGLRKLYLRPSYIFKTLKKVIFDPSKVLRYLQYGLQRLKQLS